MVRLKTNEEIKILREGGKILNSIIFELADKVKIGSIPKELDWLAENLIRKAGGNPAFKDYKPSFSNFAYPATICFSPNNIIVHGIPDNTSVNDGDIIGLDIGMEYKGLFTDMAITVAVGKISLQAKKIMNATKKALDLAISASQVGGFLGDIGFVIEEKAKKDGFSVIRNLTGHGVGHSPHELPDVYNYGKKGQGLKLKAGMVIAIEPMLAVGSGDITEQSNGAFSTKEGGLSAHFEHTIAITNKGPIVLTRP